MKIDQLKAGVILSYVSIFLSSAVSVVYTPIMLRILGQSEYGVYSIASATVSYLGLLNFGFSAAYTRYFTRAKGDAKKEAELNGMYLVMFSVIGLIALVAGSILAECAPLIFSQKLSPTEVSTARILIYILTVQTALGFPMNLFFSYIIINERYFMLKGLNALQTLVNPFVILPVLLSGGGSVGMVTASLLVTVVVWMLNIVYSLGNLKMKFAFSGMSREMFRDIGTFSAFIFLNSITDQINWGADKYILGIVKGAEAVAVYSIGSQFHTYYMNFSYAISGVFTPRVNRLVVEGSREVELLFRRVGRIQFLVLSLIMSGFVLFGREFIALWAGEGYEQSYPTALLLMLPLTIPMVQVVGLEIQRARNMHKFYAVVSIFMSLANIAISVPLSSRFGAAGAAAGTGAVILVVNGILINWYYQSRMKLDMKAFWKGILKLVPPLILPVLVGLLLNGVLPADGWGKLAIKCVLYTVIFAGSMWLFGMNDEEKRHLLKKIR